MPALTGAAKGSLQEVFDFCFYFLLLFSVSLWFELYEIIHRGRAVSPNQFAQAFARTTRNAWTDLFIRRPGDKNYTIACRLRSQPGLDAA